MANSTPDRKKSSGWASPQQRNRSGWSIERNRTPRCVVLICLPCGVVHQTETGRI